MWYRPSIVDKSLDIGDAARPLAFATGACHGIQQPTYPIIFWHHYRADDSDLMRPHLRPRKSHPPRNFVPPLPALLPHGWIHLARCRSFRRTLWRLGCFGRNRVVGGGSAFDGRLALNRAMF